MNSVWEEAQLTAFSILGALLPLLGYQIQCRALADHERGPAS